MTVCNEKSLPWIRMQKRFLKDTTTNYNHAIYFNNVKESPDSINNSIIVGVSHNNLSAQKQHLQGLQSLLQYARSHAYTNYLILDSDCFPIAHNWISTLLPKLETYHAACIIRTENCNVFPHPSACFFTDPWKINFDIVSHRDLCDAEFTDVTCIANTVFPLLRTNRRNPNLLISGIYYDLFYHHGCGSRNLHMRTMPNVNTAYYNEIGKSSDELRKELFADPMAFIARLMNAD